MQRPVQLGERKFNVLVTDLFTAEDRAKISASLAKFSNVPDLMAGASLAGLGCTRLDIHGRAWVVTYNGVEICLLFERQLQEVDAGMATTPSVKTADANRNPWLRVDLLDLQDGSVHQVLEHPYAQLSQKYQNLNGLLVCVQRECDAKGYLITGLEARIKELEAAMAKKHVAVPASKPIQVTQSPGPGHTIELPPNQRPKKPKASVKPKAAPPTKAKAKAKAVPKTKAKPKAKAKSKSMSMRPKRATPPHKPKAKAKPKVKVQRP